MTYNPIMAQQLTEAVQEAATLHSMYIRTPWPTNGERMYSTRAWSAGWHARDAEVRRLEAEVEKQKIVADVLRTELQTVVGVVSVFGPPELLQRVRSKLTKQSE